MSELELIAEMESALGSGDCETVKSAFEGLIGKYTKSVKRLDKITKQSDRQQDQVLMLNEQLDSYKNHLEEKVHEATEHIQHLYEELERTQKEIIFRMGAICESRSKETGNHVKRVAEYSKILAIKYGLDEEEAELLRQVSPMHDIGKVGIPDNILNKPGRFTDEEFEIMKQHAQIGYEILQNSERELLKAAQIVAYEHHEKWAGGGYPRGISGEEIHIYGRITALADVFDALGSSRCYKDKWDDDKIFSLFKEERGRQFDPKLVDIFFENLDEFLKIRDEFKDII